MKVAIENKNGDKLSSIFTSTKNVRQEIIKAGQDTNEPILEEKKINLNYLNFRNKFLFLNL